MTVTDAATKGDGSHRGCGAVMLFKHCVSWPSARLVRKVDVPGDRCDTLHMWRATAVAFEDCRGPVTDMPIYRQPMPIKRWAIWVVVLGGHAVAILIKRRSFQLP